MINIEQDSRVSHKRNPAVLMANIHRLSIYIKPHILFMSEESLHGEDLPNHTDINSRLVSRNLDTFSDENVHLSITTKTAA